MYLDFDQQKTLLHFINSYSSHDGSGLTAYLTWHISKQVANAMSYLHSQHLTHGDLKPDNILVKRGCFEACTTVSLCTYFVIHFKTLRSHSVWQHP